MSTERKIKTVVGQQKVNKNIYKRKVWNSVSVLFFKDSSREIKYSPQIEETRHKELIIYWKWVSRSKGNRSFTFASSTQIYGTKIKHANWKSVKIEGRTVHLNDGSNHQVLYQDWMLELVLQKYKKKKKTKKHSFQIWIFIYFLHSLNFWVFVLRAQFAHNFA